MDTFSNRTAAGQALADLLTAYQGRDDVTVLGLVRGGVPVAAAVADRLDAPLDVLVVRKLGVPGAPEVALGALGPGGVLVRNEDIATYIPDRDIATVRQHEEQELRRREQLYRADRPRLDLTNRTAIIIDDGLATGATALAAIWVARALGAVRVVGAAPVAAMESAARVSGAADEFVCPRTPADFGAVSRYYDHFPQVTDDEVMALLRG